MLLAADTLIILLFMDTESITVVEPYRSSENMPSLADFIKQAVETQSSFRQFTCVKDVKDCDPVIIPALHQVIKETVSFYFIEISSHLDLFYFSFSSRITPTSLISNPHIEIPKNFAGIKGLHTWVNSQLVINNSSVKKGLSMPFSPLFLY